MRGHRAVQPRAPPSRIVSDKRHPQEQTDVVRSEWTAPVRACLAGEDLDWLGGACCSVALNLPTTVSCTAGVPAPPAYLRAVLRALGVADPECYALRVRTAAPIASGLSTHATMRDHQRMSTALLEELRDAALAVGFAGVKVTGAGGGGALIALAPAAATPELVERLRGALRPRHADADVLHVAATRPARDV